MTAEGDRKKGLCGSVTDFEKKALLLFSLTQLMHQYDECGVFIFLSSV